MCPEPDYGLQSSYHSETEMQDTHERLTWVRVCFSERGVRVSCRWDIQETGQQTVIRWCGEWGAWSVFVGWRLEAGKRSVQYSAGPSELVSSRSAGWLEIKWAREKKGEWGSVTRTHTHGEREDTRNREEHTRVTVHTVMAEWISMTFRKHREWFVKTLICDVSFSRIMEPMHVLILHFMIKYLQNCDSAPFSLGSSAQLTHTTEMINLTLARHQHYNILLGFSSQHQRNLNYCCGRQWLWRQEHPQHHVNHVINQPMIRPSLQMI